MSRTAGHAGATGAQPSPTEHVPRAVRWFVRAFLVAFLVCGVVGIEAWPLTGFRLFSHLRHATETSSVAVTVGADGGETPLWFTDLPRAYQGFNPVMASFRALPARSQLATCRAWLAEARHVRTGVTALRIYSLRRPALPRRGDHPATPPTRTLIYACR